MPPTFSGEGRDRDERLDLREQPCGQSKLGDKSEQSEMPPDMAPPRGIATQPSMSATLMRAETIAPGSKIWAEDDERVWILTEVIRQDNTILTVRDKTGQEIEIDLVREPIKVLYR